MKLREINKKEFIDFCKKNPYSNFFQTKEYAEFSRKNGWHSYFLGIDQNGKIKAATMLLSKNIKFSKYRFFYAPRGFIMNLKDLELLNFFTTEIKKFIEDKKGIALRITPYYPLKQLDNNGNYIPGGFNNEKVLEILNNLGYQYNNNSKCQNLLYTLNLKGKNNDELLNQFDQKYQDIIKKNQEIGINTREIEPENLSIITNLYNQNKTKIDFFNNLKSLTSFYEIFKNSKMVKIRLVELDIDYYYKKIKKELSQSETSLIEIDDYNKLTNEMKTIEKLQFKYGHNVVIGFNISVYYNNEVTTLSTSINDLFISYNPIYTLFWETIKDAKKNSFELYNFYGINNNLSNTNILYQYYKGFNGQVQELIGTFDFVLKPTLYKIYRKYFKNI